MKKTNTTQILIIAGIIFVAVLLGMVFIREKGENTDVTANTTKVGLVIAGKKNDNSYCQTHYDGLDKIKDELNLEIIVKESIPENEACTVALKELIEDEGCRIIVGASFGYGQYIATMAEMHPEVYFFHPLGSQKSTNMTSCIGRMYQARYLAGIVAAMRTKNDEIGYIASFPNTEVIRDINAFALGVKNVKKDAKVYVRYCNSWTDDATAKKATQTLLDTHPFMDVIAVHCNSLMPNYVADERGIWSIGVNKDNAAKFPDSYLTTCEWQWDKYYLPHILSCLQGKFYGNVEWMEMESGVFGLSELTSNAAPGTEEALQEARERFSNRSFDVFYGPVYDNEGTLRVPEGESMSEDEMMKRFDWYVEGVTVEE